MKSDLNTILYVDENTFDDWKTFIEKCLHKWNCKQYVFDDYVSEMFIVLCKCFNTFNENKNIKFTTYLYTSMRHKYVELEKKRINHEMNINNDDEFENINLHDESDEFIDIDEILQQLTTEERYIVQLLVNGVSHRRMHEMGITNVQRKINKIRTKIQKYMEE